MPDPKLHRFLAGGWNAMSKDDTRIYYDGAWHDPCSGPKTLWHYKDGTWHKFPCGEELIYFVAYPNGYEAMQRIQAVGSTGGVLTTNGDKITAFTVSALNDASFWNYSQLFVTRDYSKIYTVKGVGIGNEDVFQPNRYTFLEIDGDTNDYGPGEVEPPHWVSIQFDLTNRGNNVAPAAPLWVEAEIASDGGFRWMASDNGGVGPILRAVYSDGTENFFNLYDSDSDGFYDSIQDQNLNIAQFISSPLDQTQWHTIRWKLVDSVATGSIKWDSTELTGSSWTFADDPPRIVSISIGVIFDNPNGGWLYLGRFKVGTAPGLSDILIYTTYTDGYPWSTEHSPLYDEPNTSNSPDLTQHKPYYIDMWYAGKDVSSGPPFPGGEPDSNIFWSYPSFSVANQFPPSGGAPVSEIWELDQSGLEDVTISNAVGYPSKRVYQMYHGTNDVYPNFWLSLRPQITGRGLEATAEYIEQLDPYPGREVRSLYRIDIDTDTRHLIKSGFDYPSGGGTAERYQTFYAFFSPSGDKIGFIKQNISFATVFNCINRDGTGETALIAPTPQVSYFHFDPLDESRFYYGSYGANYTIRKGYTDGVTNPDILFTAPSGVGIFFVPKISPDGTKISFLMDDGPRNLYVMNADGSDPINLTATFDWTDRSTPNDWCWSKDGTKILLLVGNYSRFDEDHNTPLEFWVVNIASPDFSSGPIIDTWTDTILTADPYIVLWFYGHQSEPNYA